MPENQEVPFNIVRPDGTKEDLGTVNAKINTDGSVSVSGLTTDQMSAMGFRNDLGGYSIGRAHQHGLTVYEHKMTDEED